MRRKELSGRLLSRPADNRREQMVGSTQGKPRFWLGIVLGIALAVAAAIAPTARTTAFTAQQRTLHAGASDQGGGEGKELVARVSQWGARSAAPFSRIADGAQANAMKQDAAMPKGQLGSWTPEPATTPSASTACRASVCIGRPTTADRGRPRPAFPGQR